MRFFYIESIGGAGTAWLQKILNSIPEFFCIQGPEEADLLEDRLDYVRMIKRLTQMSANDRSAKVVGALHGCIGPQAGDIVRELGGGFSYIVRHPFDRIHSLHSHHLVQINKYTPKDGDVYGTMEGEDYETSAEDIVNYLNGRETSNPLKDYEHQYIGIVKDVFHYDVNCYKKIRDRYSNKI